MRPARPPGSRGSSASTASHESCLAIEETPDPREFGDESRVCVEQLGLGSPALPVSLRAIVVEMNRFSHGSQVIPAHLKVEQCLWLSLPSRFFVPLPSLADAGCGLSSMT